MEELTPAQRRIQREIQEEIQKKVGILKFVRTYVRLAGLAVQFAGLFLNISLVTFIGFFLSYAVSVGIMEDINLLIWDKSDEQKNEEDENA